MKHNRWQQVNSIYYAAIDVEPEQRAEFIDNECSGDETLLREVESLLESHKRANVGLWLQPRLRLPRGVLVQDDTQGLIGPQMEGCGAGRMAS
jgi:hypothetical protein